MPVALALIGGGRMGEALLRGLLTAGWSAAEVAVVEVSAERAAELRAAHPGLAVASEAPAADAAVVAVKPGDVPDACRAATAGGATRLLSIAAGVPIARLEESAGPGVAVLRAMPNTAALVGQAASALAAGPSAGPADEEWAAGVLGAVGRVVRVPERLMDAVTGLSGSGPAYVFLVAEALIDGGVAAGLPRDASVQLTVQTLLGAARLLAETGDTPQTLRAMVTSPGGTTAAGLRVLESRAVRAAFIDAVAAAAERSHQLGG